MLSTVYCVESPTRAPGWRSWKVALGAGLIFAVTGCVSSAKYDDALTRIEGDAARIQSLNARIVGCQSDLAQAQSRAGHDVRELQEALDRETALAQGLRTKLEELGQDVDKLLAEKGALAVTLRISKVKLAALRRAQAAAEARAALFRDIAHKLQKMIEAGELNVLLRDGRMVIVLPNDVLFDSGQVDIKPAGRDSLKRVTAVLKTLEGRHLQVAGHTDTVPISTQRFPSNWELSTSRALEVTRFLIGQGVRVEMLSAAGYGEFDPIAPNETPTSRARNRRIEITLVPAIDEMVSLPE
jgi:chemotaxis protein MotB